MKKWLNNVSRYFFILGRNPSLALAEILAVLSVRKIDYNFQLFSSEVAVFSINSATNISILIKVLGGTVKIGKIVDEVGLDESQDEFDKIFLAQNLVNNYISGNLGKLHFGISLYNGGGSLKYVAQFEKMLPDLNKEIKNNLKDKGVRTGFLRIKERYLSSVSVYKNQLLSKGVEIVLILTDDKLLIGKTLTVQEFEKFSYRDIGRPEIDKKSGIMPPKLARIMINLSRCSQNDVLLDPFCGSGTIIQESAILGYRKIIGSDISEKAVSDTQKNLDWLFDRFRELEKPSYNIKLIKSDVRLITRFVNSNSVNAIVSEPYLGPPLYKKPEVGQINQILNELKIIYFEAFNQFGKILDSGGKIIIVFPVFEIFGKLYFLEILEKIKDCGFIQKDFIPPDLINSQNIELTKRKTILYGNNSYFAKREILSFEKK